MSGASSSPSVRTIGALKPTVGFCGRPNGWRLSGECATRVRCSRGLRDANIGREGQVVQQRMDAGRAAVVLLIRLKVVNDCSYYCSAGAEQWASGIPAFSLRSFKNDQIFIARVARSDLTVVP